MKSAFSPLIHFFISYCLVLSSVMMPAISFSQTAPMTDTTLDEQKAACALNTASYWDAARNRCVGKEEDRQTRHEAQDCNKIEDLTQRAECHKKLAEQKTGLSADPNSLNQGNTTGSMVMNGVGTAYAVIGMINGVGKEKKDSECTSKKIFGYTAMAGFASDIFLKIRAKKKIKELQDKYKLETDQGAYDAQVKALQYLKEEQETVVDIASMEKKRNMLLMLGYGAASVMAMYEMATVGTTNPGCFKPDPKKDAKTETTAQAAPEPQPAAQPSSQQSAAQQSSSTPVAEQSTTPPVAQTPPPATAAPAVADTSSAGVATEPTTNVNVGQGSTMPAAEPPGVSIDHTTKNGKQFLDIKNDPMTGSHSSIIDNNVVDYKTGQKLGTVDYSKGVINYNGGKTFPINNVNSSGFSAPVSVGKTGLTGSGFDWRSSACRAGKC